MARFRLGQRLHQLGLLAAGPCLLCLKQQRGCRVAISLLFGISFLVLYLFDFIVIMSNKEVLFLINPEKE